MLAPADQISLWLHGVGHEVARRGRVAVEFSGSRRPPRSARRGRDSVEPVMSSSGPGQAAPAGGPLRHIPVLLREVIANLAPHDGGTYIDGTYGAGGYTAAILAAGDTRVIAIDRDPTAVAAGRSEVEKAAGRPPPPSPASSLCSPASPAISGSRRSMASSSISACRPCNSTPPSAASRSASTDRSTCAWATPVRR